MKTKFRPVAMLEDFLAKAFHLQAKGRKLLEVGFALFGATIGVLLLLLATLSAYKLNPYFWWIPWFPVFCWASWRFFIRYLLLKGAFACSWCGRLKLREKQTFNESGRPLNVCAQCEERSGGLGESVQRAHKVLDLLREEVAFVKKHSDE